MLKTGIVILNYNDSETTIELVKRIEHYDSIDLIVVVDNKSTDDSYRRLMLYENEKIKVLQAEENKGYGAGNNIGIKYLAQKNIDYIIISNPDIIFNDEDIRKLCEGFTENTAIISPVIKENGTLNRGWKFIGPVWDSFTNINYLGRFFKKRQLYKSEHYNKKYSKVDVVSGCFFIARSDVFEKIDYFDENVFLYYEENIIAKKIKNIGMDIIVDNDVEIIHNHSVSVNKSYDKIGKFKILARSQRYYHEKYNGAGALKMTILYISYIIAITISWILKKFGL